MREQPEAFMRGTDAFAWHLEKDPALHSTVVSITWLERTPDFGVLTARLEAATHMARRFRQRPVEPPARLAPPRWVDVDFDISLHLHQFDSPLPHTVASVIDFARLQTMRAFDLSRPLWEFTLIGNLTGGRAALVMKIHHSLTDGIGGMQLARLLFDASEEPGTIDHVPAAPEPHPTPGTIELIRESLAYNWSRTFDTIRYGLVTAVPLAARMARHPSDSASDALATVRSIGRFVAPVPDTLSPIMTDRSLDRHLDMLAVELDDLKRAAGSVGGSVNDGFIASVTCGLQRYHERHNALVEELRMTLPISVRKEDDPAGGNRITLERFKVPLAIADAGQQVRLIGQRCRLARDDRAQPLSNAIASVLALLPTGVIGSMLKHIDFIASNVPGADVPIFLAGAPVSGHYVFGPTTGTAVNATLLSYDGTCCIGFTFDTAAVPDPAVLINCLREGFEAVLALAGDHHPVEMPLQREGLGASRSGRSCPEQTEESSDGTTR
ncbi:MAG: wax ester/triacylglycerol synthase domain-containing protein [Acidimicrobiales bacterium]|jgi:WS/DGAT/MGAT family acyltransferase